MKRLHLALGVADVEASANDYLQRFGCQPDLFIPGKDALCAQMWSTCRFGKWATKRVGLGPWIRRCVQERRCYLTVINWMESSAD